jgi:hypothetical protein
MGVLVEPRKSTSRTAVKSRRGLYVARVAPCSPHAGAFVWLEKETRAMRFLRLPSEPLTQTDGGKGEALPKRQNEKQRAAETCVLLRPLPIVFWFGGGMAQPRWCVIRGGP